MLIFSLLHLVEMMPGAKDSVWATCRYATWKAIITKGEKGQHAIYSMVFCGRCFTPGLLLSVVSSDTCRRAEKTHQGPMSAASRSQKGG